MDHVVAKLRDMPFLRAMTERTYRDLVASGHYSQQALARAFDEVLAMYGNPISQRRKVRYRLASLERPCAIAISNANEEGPAMVAASSKYSERPAGGRIAHAFAGRTACLESIHYGCTLASVNRIRRPSCGISQACCGGQVVASKVSERPFEVRLDFNPERGALVLESHPLPSGKIPVGCSLGALSLEHQVKSMVWNHSAVGGTVRYAIAPFLRIKVCVGNYDLHSFEGFIKLMRRALNWLGICADTLSKFRRCRVEPPSPSTNRAGQCAMASMAKANIAFLLARSRLFRWYATGKRRTTACL